MKKFIATGVAGGIAAVSLLGAGTAQAYTDPSGTPGDNTLPVPHTVQHFTGLTQQELIVEAGNRAVVTVAGLGQAVTGLPQLVDVFVNGVPVSTNINPGGPNPFPNGLPAALRHPVGDAGLKLALGNIVDAPQWIADPLIEAVAISVPKKLGGGSDGIPENGPNAPGDGAIIQVRDTTLLKVRDDVKKQVNKVVDAAAHVRDSIQGNDSPTVKKDAVVKKDAKKPSVRDSVRAAVHKSVAAHVAKATKVRDAIKKALTPKDK